MAAALGSKKPVVALIFSGGSVSVDALKNAPNAAVVYPGFGGEVSIHDTYISIDRLVVIRCFWRKS